MTPIDVRSGLKFPLRIAITVAIASVVCAAFFLADVPLPAPGVLTVTAAVLALVEGSAWLWRVLHRKRRDAV